MIRYYYVLNFDGSKGKTLILGERSSIARCVFYAIKVARLFAVIDTTVVQT